MSRVIISKSLFVRSFCMTSGGPGSGAGKGGGSGGAVRDAGGAFGEMEAAREEEYFRKKRVEQLAKLKVELEKAEATNELETAANLKKTIAELHKEDDVTKKFSIQDKILCVLLFLVFMQAFRRTFFNGPLVPFLFR